MKSISIIRMTLAAGALTFAGLLAAPASALPTMAGADGAKTGDGIVQVQMMDRERMRHRMMRREMRHDMRRKMMRRQMMRHEMRRMNRGM
jgi:hypothetical protein